MLERFSKGREALDNKQVFVYTPNNGFFVRVARTINDSSKVSPEAAFVEIQVDKLCITITIRSISWWFWTGKIGGS